LAVALGLCACALGFRTAFVTAAGLIASLTRAHNENRLEEKLKLLVQPKLLVIDEIGYLPRTPAGVGDRWRRSWGCARRRGRLGQVAGEPRRRELAGACLGG
jgi:hypothetical protein